MNLPELSKAVADIREKVNALFSGKSTVNAEQVEAFKADVNAINQKLASAEQLSADLSTAKQTISSVVAERDALTARVAELVAESETAKTKTAEEISAVKAETDRIAAVKAAAIAKGQGIPAVATKVSDAQNSPTMLEQYQILTGVEKTEFYRANKAALILASRK